MADQIDEVKQKTDIVSLISEYVDLKKAGRNYKGLCPFHSEKTPSFMVSPELQIYKCFGCGMAGDAYSFLQEHEGMDFGEALKFLADRAGVKLKPTSFQKRGEKDIFYEINSLTGRFYQYVLLKHPAGKKGLSYLTKERGLKLDTIKVFKLGFAPENPQALKSFLVDKKKTKVDQIEKAGIAYKKGKDLVDRFRGRVIFPLFDQRGNPVGFAGRVLPGAKKDSAKYINSPETPIYNKSTNLYGLNFTRSEIKKEKKAIVVEGELDLISSWQAGVKNVVASKGTALTEGQVRLLSRITPAIILALDADFAGNEAARRGINIAQNEGLDVSVVELRGFKDPDEAARKDPKAYKKALKNAVDVWEFVIDSTVAKYGAKSAPGKAKISRELTPILAKISDKIVQAHYIKLLATKLDVSEESVTSQVSRMREEKEQVTEVDIPKVVQKGRRELLEERLLTLLLHFDSARLADKSIQALISTSFSNKILAEYKKYGKKEVDLKKFGDELPAELKEGFADMVLADTERMARGGGAFEKELSLVVKELRIFAAKDKLKDLQKKIGEMEREGKKRELKKAEQAFSKLSEKLSALEEDESEGIILADNE